MDFATCLAEVRDRLGEPTENFFKTTAIKRALNEGHRRFCYEDEWPWLQRAATGTLALNDETKAIQSAIDPLRQVILQLTPDTGDTRIRAVKRVSLVQGEELRRNYSGSAVVADEPLYWYLLTGGASPYANTIRIVPKADKAYDWTMVYFAQPVELTADADLPLIPDQYQMAVVHYATAQCWRKELNTSAKGQEEMGSYLQVLDNAKRNTKSQAIDEKLVWGGQDPEYAFEPDWVRLHIPGSLSG